MKYMFFTLACLILNTQINCNSTAVQLANINPTTGGSINEPGHYYLGWDVAGPITIAADRVTLNLNGHTVQQCIITNQKDIRLMNGVFDGTGITVNLNVIILTTCQNVRLSDLTIQNGPAGTPGIGVNNCSFLFINNCISINNGTHGILCIAASDIFISNSTFADNGAHGLSLGGSRILVRNCEANGNTSNGLQATSTTALYVYDCIAKRNVQYGFNTAANSHFNGFRCLATDNGGDGFISTPPCLSNWIDCIAQQNSGSGFNLGGNTTSPTLFVKDCSAMYNGQCGFNDALSDGSRAAWVANVAFLNRVIGSDESNYCRGNGVCASAGVNPFCFIRSTDPEAQYWRNVSTAITC